MMLEVVAENLKVINNFKTLTDGWLGDGSFAPSLEAITASSFILMTTASLLSDAKVPAYELYCAANYDGSITILYKWAKIYTILMKISLDMNVDLKTETRYMDLYKKVYTNIQINNIEFAIDLREEFREFIKIINKGYAETLYKERPNG